MNNRTKAAELARMLTLDPVEAVVWHPQDLRAMWRDLMTEPIDVDLSSPAAQACEHASSAPGGATIRTIQTFEDALHSDDAPLELLMRIKQFAKLQSSHPCGTLPRDVASVLYFAAIVAARRSHDRAITGLEDQAIGRAIQWAVRQPWLDDTTRTLLTQGQTMYVR